MVTFFHMPHIIICNKKRIEYTIYWYIYCTTKIVLPPQCLLPFCYGVWIIGRIVRGRNPIYMCAILFFCHSHNRPWRVSKMSIVHWIWSEINGRSFLILNIAEWFLWHKFGAVKICFFSVSIHDTAISHIYRYVGTRNRIYPCVICYYFASKTAVELWRLRITMRSLVVIENGHPALWLSMKYDHDYNTIFSL